MIVIIPLLFAISAAGLVSVIINALQTGAEVYSSEYSQETAQQFEDIFLFIPPRRIAEIGWMSCLLMFGIVFLLVGDFRSPAGTLLGLLAGGMAGSAALYTPKMVLHVLRRRRMEKFNNQLVDALLTMSNALKAGFSIMQSIETVIRESENPLAQEFDVLLQQTRVGVNFSEALRNLDERVGSADLSLVVMAIESARRTGGNLTEVFEKISKTIRERLRIQNRIRTLTAQGRLQGIIVGAMPIIILSVLLVVDPGLMLPFLRSPVGLGIMVVVAGLIACGAAIIRKIINIDV